MLRDCIDCVNHPKGEKDRKYPPLSPAERQEFNKLDRKRRKLWDASPAVQQSLLTQRRQIRRMLTQLSSIIERSPAKTKPASRII